MRTVQLTLDDTLVREVDAAAEAMGTTRSALTRQALRAALDRIKELEMERQHREGYSRKPVRPKEFKPWEREQVWGDG